MATIYRCPECGGRDNLYTRGDFRWDYARREWKAVMDSIEEGVDCTECDYVGPIADFEMEEDAR